LSDGRALISFDESMTPARFNSRSRCARRRHADERGEVLASIRDLLRDARRSASVTLSQRHIIVLERNGGKNHDGKKTHRK
jgi:hypothetical protein